jgi:hypothetical protein
MCNGVGAAGNAGNAGNAASIGSAAASAPAQTAVAKPATTAAADATILQGKPPPSADNVLAQLMQFFQASEQSSSVSGLNFQA